MIREEVEAYFPNEILHSWTYDGQYYVISVYMKVYCSSDKFTVTSNLIGELPFPEACTVEVNQLNVPSDEHRITVNNNYYGDFTKVVTSIFVNGSNIFVEYVDLVENVTLSYISRSFGASWNLLTSLNVTTPGYVSNYFSLKDKVWRGGLSGFMVPDRDGCNLYIFKPLFKQKDDVNFPGQYDVAGWLVVSDVDVVISNSSVESQNKSTFENRFKDSGFMSYITDDTNHMANTREIIRKPYQISWPYPRDLDIHDIGYNPEEISLEHRGYVVNPIDVVRYTHNDTLYMIARVPYGATVRIGSVEKINTGSGDQYSPDTITFNIPVLYVVNVGTIPNATIENKFSIRTHDILGFDVVLASLNSSVYTKNLGVYSFIENYVCDDGDFLSRFIEKGAIYEGGGEDSYIMSSNITCFSNQCSGDIMKITDPVTGGDVVGFIGRGRAKVCTTDPMIEAGWKDVTKSNTYRRGSSLQNVATGSLFDDSELTTIEQDVWDCSYPVLRYDFNDSRLLGLSKVVYPTEGDDDPSLIYTFPSFIKIGSTYTIGKVVKSTFPFKNIGEVSADFSNTDFNIADVNNYQASNPYIDLYYGGFVGAGRGFVGSLEDFVVGIVVPPEPDFPVIPTNPGTPYTGNPLPAPNTLAILDDVKRSASAIVQPGRLSVIFGTSNIGSQRGGVVSNIGVNSGRYYIELSNITSFNLYFGLAKATADMEKEPGADAGVLAVGLNGTVTIGNKAIYRHNTPILTDNSDAANAVIGVLIDLNERTFQYTDVDGNWYGSGIGSLPMGTLHFYVGSVDDFTEPKTPTSVSLNMGAFPFVYDIPNDAHAGFGII